MRRVVIVDDHRVIIDGLQRLLDLEPGIQVVGTAISASEGVAVCQSTRPDAVLLDLRLPDARGTTAVTTFRKSFPDLRIVALTGHGTVLKDQALAAGADAFLTKELASDDIVRAIFGDDRPEFAAGSDLSDREREISMLAALGMSNPEISRELTLSPNTVKTHLANAMDKLNVRNRTELAIRLRQIGTSG